MVKKFIIGVVALVVLIAGLGGWKALHIKKAMADGASFAMPPEAVTTVKAREENWEQTLNAVGTLTSFQGVMISAEEAGKVVEIKFESGQEVQQGDLLIKLDTSVEEAQLKALEAKAALTASNQKRMQELFKEQVSTQSELDDSESQFKQAEADANALRATIARRAIRAPFTGRVGLRRVNLGQYLSPGAAVVELQSLRPIYVDFTLAQRYIDRATVGQAVRLTIDAFPSQPFDGKITAISPQVDEATRNLKVQATFENADEKLRPGMFGSIAVVGAQQDKAITIPSTAINYAPYGDSVYIVESIKSPEGKTYTGVRQQFVKLGPTRGDQVAVLEGIKPGEEVVTSGLFKLRPGAAVQVNNSVQPGNNPAPQPANS
jgi:membrane fusion protein (multidrug efflux system)